jgi:branched-chain amino acid transport system permease protein
VGLSGLFSDYGGSAQRIVWMETLRSAFDFSDFPRIDLMIVGAVLIYLLTFPLFPLSAFAMATMIQFLMFSIYGMGWNTIGGYGGQVDLGKAQYVGIGAYTTAVMLIRWDIPFWVSMPIGVCFSVAWSFIIGYPLFRLKGHYFAIATIATSLVLKNLFEIWGFVGAARGLEISPIKYHPPDFLRLIFKEDVYYYYAILGIFLLAILYINWFRKSRLGFQLRSIKDNEDAARSLGINVHWAKIKTYAIATAFVSVVGSFHACYIKAIEPEDTMSLDISILIALMAMLGGAGSMWGPIIGAGILIPLKSYLKEWLGATAGLVGIDLVLYAAIIMIISAFEPRGIWGIVEKIRRRKRS